MKRFCGLHTLVTHQRLVVGVLYQNSWHKYDLLKLTAHFCHVERSKTSSLGSSCLHETIAVSWINKVYLALSLIFTHPMCKYHCLINNDSLLYIFYGHVLKNSIVLFDDVFCRLDPITADSSCPTCSVLYASRTSLWSEFYTSIRLKIINITKTHHNSSFPYQVSPPEAHHIRFILIGTCP